MKILDGFKKNIFNEYNNKTDEEEIILKKNETCQCKCSAEWHVTGVTTKHVKGHSGVSIRIVKGFSVQAGGSKSHVIKKDFVNKYKGKLFITDKRIIFTGKDKNFTVIYPNLISIKPSYHGFEFQTEKTNYNIFVVDAVDIDRVNLQLKEIFTSTE